MQTNKLFGQYQGIYFEMQEHPFRPSAYLLITQDAALAKRLGFATPSNLYYSNKLPTGSYILAIEAHQLEQGFYAELRTEYEGCIHRLDYDNEGYKLYPTTLDDNYSYHRPRQGEEESNFVHIPVACIDTIWEERIPLEDVPFDTEYQIFIRYQGKWIEPTEERLADLQEQIVRLTYGDDWKNAFLKKATEEEESIFATPKNRWDMAARSGCIVISVLFFLIKVFFLFNGLTKCAQNTLDDRSPSIPQDTNVWLMGAHSTPLGKDSLSVRLFFAISGENGYPLATNLRLFGKRGKLFAYPDCVDKDGNLSPDLAFASYEIRQPNSAARSVYQATFHVHKDLLEADDLLIGIFTPPTPEPLGHTLLPYAIPAPLEAEQ